MRRLRRNTICLDECSCYHVITRCTRQLHLLADEEGGRDEGAQRKDFLLQQLKRLATFTAVGVAGFSVMDNHLHLLLKVDTESARGWSDREVVRRWLGLHPPRDGYRQRVAVEDAHIDAVLDDPDPERVASLREKLMSISQFMKELKQEVTQTINRMDDTVGSLWAGRFKSHRVTDEAQLLTTLAYIDLNPFAAGLCESPESARHTSLAARLHGSDETCFEVDASNVNADDTSAIRPSTPAERRGWWMTLGGGHPGATRPHRAVLPGTTLTLNRYLRLIDRVARLLRRGKRRLSHDTAPILKRIAVSPAGLASTLGNWFDHGLPWDRPAATAY